MPLSQIFSSPFISHLFFLIVTVFCIRTATIQVSDFNMSTRHSTRNKKAVIVSAAEAAASVLDGAVKKVPSEEVVVAATAVGGVKQVSSEEVVTAAPWMVPLRRCRAKKLSSLLPRLVA